jgi:hypothetical protein
LRVCQQVCELRVCESAGLRGEIEIEIEAIAIGDGQMRERGVAWRVESGEGRLTPSQW